MIRQIGQQLAECRRLENHGPRTGIDGCAARPIRAPFAPRPCRSRARHARDAVSYASAKPLESVPFILTFDAGIGSVERAPAPLEFDDRHAARAGRGEAGAPIPAAFGGCEDCIGTSARAVPRASASAVCRIVGACGRLRLRRRPAAAAGAGLPARIRAIAIARSTVSSSAASSSLFVVATPVRCPTIARTGMRTSDSATF